MEPFARGKAYNVNFINTKIYFQDKKLSNALGKMYIQLKKKDIYDGIK